MKEENTSKNIKDLSNEDAIAKFKDLVKHTRVCLFATFLTEIPIQVRPMSTQEVDDEGNFWFLSSETSNKNFEIGEDSRVQLFYSNNTKSEYLTVLGHAEVLRDRKTIEEMWNPIAKAWFQEGKNDPDLTVIKVAPADAYYWDTKNSKMVSLLKIITSVTTGHTVDDGVEGELKVH